MVLSMLSGVIGFFIGWVFAAYVMTVKDRIMDKRLGGE